MPSDVDIASTGVKPIREMTGSRFARNRLLRRGGMAEQDQLYRPFLRQRQHQG
jgi:hypothetical protein